MCFQLVQSLVLVQSRPGCHLSVKSEAPDRLYRAMFLEANVWARPQSQLLMVVMNKSLPCASPNVYVMSMSSQLLPLHL